MKRGGMLRHRAARTFILHDVLPLFTVLKTQIGKNPTPEQKAVVLKGVRYYRSFADIPVDGPLKASINKLKEEFSSTEQNAAKALDIYNKILKTLEDAEKRQKENITQTPGRRRDTFSSRSMYANSPSSLFLQGTSYGSQSSPSSSSLSSSLSSPLLIMPNSLRHTHFNTPSKPNSTELTTPPRLRADEKGAQPITSDDVTRINLFQNDENKTPPPSPGIFTPPRLSSKSALGSPFSPSRLHSFRLG